MPLRLESPVSTALGLPKALSSPWLLNFSGVGCWGDIAGNSSIGRQDVVLSCLLRDHIVYYSSGVAILISYSKHEDSLVASQRQTDKSICGVHSFNLVRRCHFCVCVCLSRQALPLGRVRRLSRAGDA